MLCIDRYGEVIFVIQLCVRACVCFFFVEFFSCFLDPRGGSLSLTHVVVLVDFFVSQPTVFIETS